MSALPGPRGSFLLGSLGDYARDPLAFVTRMAREHGDFVEYRFGPTRVYQLNHPDLIEEVLVRGGAHVVKDMFTRGLEVLVGRGLLTSEGDAWKRNRKLMAPLLQKKQIERYADLMVSLSRQLAAGVTVAAERDVHVDMTRLTLDIVVRTLFDMEVGAEADGVGESFEQLTQDFMLTFETWRRVLPRWVPTAPRRRMRAAVARIDAVIYDLIARRRTGGTTGDDLLSRLMSARDDQGQPLDDLQLRDEAATMFLAGHETTALALTFALHALATYPDPAARLYGEVDRVLGHRPATFGDLGSLPYADAFVREVMRLWPPAWAIGREVVEPFTLRGHALARGSQLFISQWAMHRDPRFFEEPEAFRPERWLDGRADALPRFAYFPFGGGPRICIGNHFAMVEAVLALATLAQSLAFERTAATSLALRPAITLRPVGGLVLGVKPRAAQRAAAG